MEHLFGSCKAKDERAKRNCTNLTNWRAISHLKTNVLILKIDKTNKENS